MKVNMTYVKYAMRVLVPIAILVAGYYGAQKVASMAKPAARRSRPPRPPTVEVTTLKARDFQIPLRTRGTVRARSEVRLAAEVAGRIVSVADSFRDGGFFDRGDVLVELDARDYELAITRLTAERGQARAAIDELSAEDEVAETQIALAKQQHALQMRQLARIKELAGRGVSSASALEEAERAELAARTRWIALRDQRTTRSAKRKRLERAVALSDARLDQARLELSRTKVVAPYAGRVLRRSADVGQWVARGAALATIYSVDVAEIRLPLTQRQLARVELPERLRGAGSGSESAPAVEGPAVRLTCVIGGKEFAWEGTIVRTEGAIDAASRQLFVVAVVADPYAPDPAHPGRPPLRVGTFVFAEIGGEMLRQVHVVPRGALEGETVQIVDADGTLRRRAVRVVWRDRDQVVIDGGLKDGERLCLTPVVFAGKSIAVAVAGEEKAGRRKGGRR